MAGTWTILQNVGGKAQIASMTAAGAMANGVEGVGYVTAAYGAATLACSLSDFGYASEVGRFIARRIDRGSFATIRNGIRLRASMATLLGAALFLLQETPGARGFSVPAICSAAILASALNVQLVATSALYGLGNFKNPSISCGLARALMGIGFPIVAEVAHSVKALILWAAITELALAALTFYLLTRAARLAPELEIKAQEVPNGHYYWLGLGSVANVLINKSDTYAISLVASPSIVGLYAIASQIQNAVATLSLTPASSLPRHVASRATVDGSVRRKVYQMTILSSILAIVGGILVTVALGTATIASLDIPGLPGMTNELAVVVGICMMSVPIQTAAGVLLSAYVGVGNHRRIGNTWLQTALIALPIMLLLSWKAGAPGAAVAAIARDSVLLILGRRLWREPTGHQLDIVPTQSDRIEILTHQGMSTPENAYSGPQL